MANQESLETRIDKIIKVPLISSKLPVSPLDFLVASNIGGLASGLINPSLPVYFALGTLAVFYTWILGCGIPYKQKLFQAKKINFLETFGADIKHLNEMPLEERAREESVLIQKVNDEYSPPSNNRREITEKVEEVVTAFLSGYTGERVETKGKVRKNNLIGKVFYPFALGITNPMDGDITVPGGLGVMEAGTIAHETAHRKGYMKEMEAQVIAYLALSTSGDKELVQSANCDRLLYQMRSMASKRRVRIKNIQNSGLRDEIKRDFLKCCRRGPYAALMRTAITPIYVLRMKLSGQKNMDDYSKGFTNFLYTIGNKVT